MGNVESSRASPVFDLIMEQVAGFVGSCHAPTIGQYSICNAALIELRPGLLEYDLSSNPVHYVPTNGQPGPVTLPCVASTALLWSHREHAIDHAVSRD